MMPSKFAVSWYVFTRSSLDIKDSEATLHLLYKHQRDLANHPGNPHLYSCDFCTRRNMLPCDAECHRAAHMLQQH
ncbi:hypothetical protein T492DRAFT_872174 [Pavlovales sp. CCMP2436]|nr:hypothetical protein T492DRAFT_872174 [Pavlovales sp. CCMP2436]